MWKYLFWHPSVLKLLRGFGIKLNAGPSIGYCVSDKPSVYSQMYSYEIGANMGIDFVLNKKYIIGVESQYGLSKITDQNNRFLLPRLE